MRVYLTLNYPGFTVGDKTLLTGIKANDKYYITGFYKHLEETITFVYYGTVSGADISNINNWHTLNYPGAAVTNLYGPAVNCRGIRAVGNYTIAGGSQTYGCLYQGTLAGKGLWKTIMPPKAINCICHSTMKNLLVGNYSIGEQDAGNAFIYNIKHDSYDNITLPDVRSITAYGIWYNGKNNYTICGGADRKAYIVDYNSKDKKLSNWQFYRDGLISHFEGISAAENGYSLVADIVDGDQQSAKIAYVKRKNNGRFSSIKWESLAVPNQNTSGNSIAGSTAIGVSTDSVSTNGFISIVI